METWPLKNNRDEVFAFEVPNRFFSSSSIARYFAQIPGVTITETRRMFSIGNEVHVRFAFLGQRFCVWEAWGDNSRLWVGPDEKEPQRHESIDSLMAAVSDSI